MSRPLFDRMTQEKQQRFDANSKEMLQVKEVSDDLRSIQRQYQPPGRIIHRIINHACRQRLDPSGRRLWRLRLLEVHDGFLSQEAHIRQLPFHQESKGTKAQEKRQRFQRLTWYAVQL